MTQEGPVAEAGLAALRGARLAIERRNSEGGVLGLSIEAVNFDSRCTAEGGRRATSETREQELTLLVGGLCASEAVAMSESMTGESVFLSLNAHPRVAVDDSGMHRQGVYVTPLPDVLQAHAMARYAREHLHAQTAATLHDERSSLGANLTGTFSQVFLEEGGEIAGCDPGSRIDPSRTCAAGAASLDVPELDWPYHLRRSRPGSQEPGADPGRGWSTAICRVHIPMMRLLKGRP